MPAELTELQSKVAEIVAALCRRTATLSCSYRTHSAWPRPTPPACGTCSNSRNSPSASSRRRPWIGEAIASPAWDARRDEIAGLVKAGQAHAETQAVLRGILTEDAWQTDLRATRQALAGHGRSLFRWFRKDYRDAVATLRGVLKGEMPRKLADRLAIVDAVIGFQSSLAMLDNDPERIRLGQDAFGTGWKGSKSDWPVLAEIVKWEAETP